MSDTETTGKDAAETVENYLEQRRKKSALEASPLLRGDMLRPASAASLVRSAATGARDLTGFVNVDHHQGD